MSDNKNKPIQIKSLKDLLYTYIGSVLCCAVPLFIPILIIDFLCVMIYDNWKINFLWIASIVSKIDNAIFDFFSGVFGEPHFIGALLLLIFSAIVIDLLVSSVLGVFLMIFTILGPNIEEKTNENRFFLLPDYSKPIATFNNGEVFIYHGDVKISSGKYNLTPNKSGFYSVYSSTGGEIGFISVDEYHACIFADDKPKQKLIGVVDRTSVLSH